jgi:alkanesulfonate monooxygenase SsuD/methylene tetrahydromethanopterin reductase-like flavin-dependent oxidoreductase (luciferase family)
MVDFGFALKAGPAATAVHDYIPHLDRVLPHYQAYFKSLWMTDHFFWDMRPTHEAWTVLSYLAAHFPAYQIAPIVLGQSYRNPALLAKMAATLHALSGGRFIMGIGAGWKQDEYDAYGYDFPRPGIRLEQLRDTLEILKRMWTQPGKVTYHGAHYHIVDAICEPKPEPAPLIVVGGAGDKTIGLAAEYADWWNMPDANADIYAERAAFVRSACEKIGRDPASLRLTWFGRIAIGRTPHDADVRGGTWTKHNALHGTPAEIVDQINLLVSLGCDMFMTNILDAENPDVIDMLTRDVLPHIT